MEESTRNHPLDGMAGQRAVLLTTYKRDGTKVDTPVNIAVEGDHAFIRTYNKSGKAKRMRRNGNVEVAPSTLNGKPTGLAVPAHARLLEGQEAAHASDLIRRKHKVLQGMLVPLYHRVKRYQTLHFELSPR